MCDDGLNAGTGMFLDGTFRFHENGEDVGGMCVLGTFSQWMVISENSCVPIDEDLPFEIAALVACGVTTGWGSSVYAAGTRAGETVVIFGTGGVGINAVQGARIAGARRIIAVDPVEFKREQAQEFGATHVFSSLDEAIAGVGQLTWGEMCDKVICTFGVMRGELLEPALTLTAKGGTCVVTSVAPMAQMQADVNLFMLAMMNKEIKGTLYGSASPRVQIPRLLSLYREGILKLDELITRTYRLDEVNQGYADIEAGKILRGVIEF
jgi:S-(hydroxymethyl)glutathione dehydrogenase/alcohol dehydrogenase